MARFCGYEESLLTFYHSLDWRPKDRNFTMHVHNLYEIYFFVAGSASYLVEGSEYRLEPGCLLLMRPTESHKVRILAEKPYERYSLNFSPVILENIDPEHELLVPFLNRPLGQNNCYLPSEFSKEQPLELLEAMCAPVEDKAGQRLEILLHLLPLLGAVRHAFGQKQQGGKETGSAGLSEQIVAYINRHLFDELSLQLLAERFFLSVSQLARLFKQSTGSSVWEYITIKRLMCAREKIQKGASAGRAAQECGFGDYSSFYRAYVGHFGCSPRTDFTEKQKSGEVV